MYLSVEIRSSGKRAQQQPGNNGVQARDAPDPYYHRRITADVFVFFRIVKTGSSTSMAP